MKRYILFEIHPRVDLEPVRIFAIAREVIADTTSHWRGLAIRVLSVLYLQA
jgi:hypothetical protein